MSSRRDRVEELSLQRKSCFLSLPPSPLLLPSASVSVARMGCKALSRTRRDSGAGAEAAGAKKERERERAQQEEKKTSSSSKKKKGAANEKRAESRKQKTHPLHPACARSGRCLARVRASEARFCALERRRKKKESKENEGARSFFFKSSSHYCCCFARAYLFEFFFSLFFCAPGERGQRERERERKKKRRRLLPSISSLLFTLPQNTSGELSFFTRFLFAAVFLSTVSREIRESKRAAQARTFKRRPIDSLLLEREREERAVGIGLFLLHLFV